MSEVRHPPDEHGVIRTRRRVRIWLIVETVLAIPAVAAGVLMAMMSPMMFDAPGSTSNPYVLVLFGSVATFPFIAIIAIIAAWVALVRGHARTALAMSLLPLLPIVTGVVAAIGW